MKRRFDYDLLRVFSMLGVIYLHVAAGTLQQLSPPLLWDFSNALSCLFMPAVPLFFMLSGALLLSDERSADLGHLFRKRIPKVVVPACVWTACVLLYYVSIGSGDIALASFLRLLNNPVAVPYWFLYALVAIYLLLPMLKKMTDGMTETHWHYTMALWVFLTLGLNTIRIFLPSDLALYFTEHWTLNINLVGGYLGYFLLGYYLERFGRYPSQKGLIAALLALSVICILGTHWISYRRGAYSDHFINYLTLLTMARAALIFLLAKTCLRERSAKTRLLPGLAGLSYGVYLVHPLSKWLLDKAWRALLDPLGYLTISQQIVFYVLVVLFSILLCLILASIPGICYLFTGQTYADACRNCSLQALFGKKNEE